MAGWGLRPEIPGANTRPDRGQARPAHQARSVQTGRALRLLTADCSYDRSLALREDID